MRNEFTKSLTKNLLLFGEVLRNAILAPLLAKPAATPPVVAPRKKDFGGIEFRQKFRIPSTLQTLEVSGLLFFLWCLKFCPKICLNLAKMIKTLYRLADYSPPRQVSQASPVNFGLGAPLETCGYAHTSLACKYKKLPIIRQIAPLKPCENTEFFPPYVFKKLARQGANFCGKIINTARQGKRSMIKKIYHLADCSSRPQVAVQTSLAQVRATSRLFNCLWLATPRRQVTSDLVAKKVASGSPIIKHIDLFKPCVFTEFFPPYVFKKLTRKSMQRMIKTMQNFFELGMNR